MRYSIIIVCLNAGQRLKETIDSILSQTYKNYEIIIKDGFSKDNSVDEIINENDKSVRIVECNENEKTIFTAETIKVYRQKDTSIYDAMNQAVQYATGDYFIFMNAGDVFYDETVLNQVENEVAKLCNKETTPDTVAIQSVPDIVYGNLYHKVLKSVVNSSPEINDFTCYRNVPCHQTCFYSASLFKERGYNPEYNVRADYEHFLYCYYEKKANIKYIPITVCTYEGGGYSETKENKKKSATQHREIVVKYMGKKKANHYRRIMRLTLQPLRTMIAESKYLSGIYNAIKKAVYTK